MPPKENDDGNLTSSWLASNSFELAQPHKCDEENSSFATQLYHQVLKGLRNLYIRSDKESGSKRKSSEAENAITSLFLWGEYFEDGKLEMALEASEDMRVDIIDLLKSIGKAVLTLLSQAEAKQKSTATDLVAHSILATFVEQAETVVANTDQNGQDLVEAEAGQSTSDVAAWSETEEELYEEIHFNTRCLMQYASALRKNIDHTKKHEVQRLLPPPESFRVSHEAQAYVSLVREKFRSAALRLVERLGELNWQRHTEIRRKLYEADQSVAEEETVPVDSKFRPAPTFHDSGLGTTVSAPSQYAQSFASSIDSNSVEALRVPPTPPEVDDGKPFICFICGVQQTRIRNRPEWKMHVFADLRPYICTFSNCSHDLAQFSTRADWADHEFTQHRFKEFWRCPQCGVEKDSVQNWKKHIDTAHSLAFSGPDMLTARMLARNTNERPIDDEECLLCREHPAQTRRAFVKHVGRHMEEIALLALPRDIEEDPDIEGDPEIASDVTDESDEPSFKAKVNRKDMTAKNSHASDSHGYSPPPEAAQAIPVSSYWNVKELRDFKIYLAQYGTDWESIAVNMPAKTHTMVKNQFSRLVKAGDSDLEKIATSADEKLRRGEPTLPKPPSNVEQLTLYPPDSIYPCRVKGCSFITRRHYKFALHINTHVETKVFPCGFEWCGRNVRPFQRKDHLSEHVRKVHGGINPPKETNERFEPSQIAKIEQHRKNILRGEPS